MALEKNDLEKIRKVIREEVSAEVVMAKNEIIATVSHEISDLAEINRAVIQRVDGIVALEKRIIRLEHKVGIVS